jgi:probable HAF family extracellular repeat protein
MPVYTFTTLDNPSGRTQAHGINSAGQIVGEYHDASNHQHGFLYSGGTFTTFDDPLGTRGTSAYGINNAGQIVGAYTDANNQTHGFLYSGGTFTPLDDPLATGITQAFGINDAGQIVGEYLAGAVEHGFLYDPNRGVFPPLTSPSTIPQPTGPLPPASTTQVRSSGRTLTPVATRTASS